jgi:RNA polymerase sigma factor (sigma-70 family)
MATGPVSDVLQHIRRSVLPHDGDALTYGELLGRFVERGEAAALAALVRRHAPMVWGICRRVLGSHQDAEDAFQATFLVLVRRAESVAPRAMVANWLHGVAHQTALKARANAARRKGRERQVADLPEPQAAPEEYPSDLGPLLDQELIRMPEKYRAVVILCDLEGKTRREAAGLLGVPEGTVAGRLARARAMLAARLRRRGLDPTNVMMAGALSQSALPVCLVSSTIRVAALLGVSELLPPVLSARVAALLEGVLKSMMLTKLKAAGAIFLAIGVLALSPAQLVHRPAQAGTEQAGAARQGLRAGAEKAVLRMGNIQLRERSHRAGQHQGVLSRTADGGLVKITVGDDGTQGRVVRTAEERTGEADLKAIQGDWLLISTISEGVETRVGLNLVWRIKGNRLFHVLEGTVNVPLTLTLGGSKRYRTMDITCDGAAPCLAVYHLEGDTLRVATGGPRPKNISGRGADSVVWVMKRKKP